MTLIGMLHHRRDPQSVVKAYAYAAVAKAEGASLIFFYKVLSFLNLTLAQAF